MNDKVSLKKVNKTNESTVRTLDCKCCCITRISAAFTSIYLGVYF